MFYFDFFFGLCLLFLLFSLSSPFFLLLTVIIDINIIMIISCIITTYEISSSVRKRLQLYAN